MLKDQELLKFNDHGQWSLIKSEVNKADKIDEIKAKYNKIDAAKASHDKVAEAKKDYKSKMSNPFKENMKFAQSAIDKQKNRG